MKKFICDSHVHFWDIDKLNYNWLQNVSDLNRSFLPTDFLQVSTADELIFVQAECAPEQVLEEVSIISAFAKTYPIIQGIVAQAALEKGGQIKFHLDQLKSNPLVKGVRRLLQSEQNDFCLQNDFIIGVQMLSEYDFSFDVCIKAPQLIAVTELVKRCPAVTFILDHLGKPDIAGRQFKSWQADFSQLALQPNVVCKLSGLITEANHSAWQPEDIYPYVLHAVDVFGEDRLMFGSDWPVMNLAGNYQQWLEVVSNILSEFPESTQHKIFYQNAMKYYSSRRPVTCPRDPVTKAVMRVS
ncbi:MAG: amidohydrolase family protein [Gammaproteobacteria bacterium]|nr:amidohydrolase family protein [Gammaproteobacteria bacterium]